MKLEEAEGTWNLGIGMIAVVRHDTATGVMASLRSRGIESWVAGRVSTGALPEGASTSSKNWEQGAKGVDGGAARLVGVFS